MMLVVIDTNVMLSALARDSPIGPLFAALTDGRVSLAVSAPILFEYEEVAADRGGAAFAARILRFISLVSATLDSVMFVSPSYQFHVIRCDPDDNKFTDCAIAVHADFVITNDSDFASLVDAGYKPQPIRPEDFISRYLSP